MAFKTGEALRLTVMKFQGLLKAFPRPESHLEQLPAPAMAWRMDAKLRKNHSSSEPRRCRRFDVSTWGMPFCTKRFDAPHSIAAEVNHRFLPSPN